jgi:CMP-N-acetylneuraminic acid synthetase
MAEEIIAFIHAKGESTRLPGKNLRVLGDKPLVAHAITTALKVPKIDKVVIDSEDADILRVGEMHGAEVLVRPNDLADNNTTGDDLAVWQASNFVHSKICIQLVPTSPFIKPETVMDAIDNLLIYGYNSSFAVRSDKFYHWLYYADGSLVPNYYHHMGTDRLPNSFEIPETIYETTGLYANRTESIFRTKKRIDITSFLPVWTDRVEAIDINTLEDFQLAEYVWKGMHT